MYSAILNGTSSVRPLQGTSSVRPVQGTMSVVPMQGSNGRTYYVSPITAMVDVPSDLIPSGLSPNDEMILRAAYLSGDPRALNGKLGDAIKKVGTKWLQVAQVAVPIVLTAVPGGVAVAPAAAAALGALNNKIASDQANNKPGLSPAVIEQAGAVAAAQAMSVAQAAGLPGKVISNAGQMAAQTTKDLIKVGVVPDAMVVAERSVIAADGGAQSYRSGLASWWAERSTNEKVLIGVGVAAAVGGTIYYFTRSKKGKKRRK